MDMQAKIMICLWYDGDAEGAARFYAKTFPDSSVGAVEGVLRDVDPLLQILLLLNSGTSIRN